MRYLSRQQVEETGISMAEMIEAVEAMFRDKGHGRVEMPPKPGIHTRPDAFIHAMPAYLPGAGAAGMKWISGYPANQARGLPYNTGLMILNDDDTGIPIAVMDATWLTAMRTGAATAVAAKYLARASSSRVGILACGVQGRSNLTALAEQFELETVRAFDVDADAARSYALDMGTALGLDVAVVDEPQAAVAEMDIVVTSGPILKKPSPAIAAGWLEPGSFACPLDFDSYWQGDALAEADKLCTDDADQLRYYRDDGYFQATPMPWADLGEVVAGRKPGRESDQERIISINLGLALADLAVAALIHRAALEKDIGTDLET